MTLAQEQLDHFCLAIAIPAGERKRNILGKSGGFSRISGSFLLSKGARDTLIWGLILLLDKPIRILY
jgi:hypothetical protein